MTSRKLLIALLCASQTLSACSGLQMLGQLGSLASGGTNTAASVDLQAGKTNTDQLIGTSEVNNQKVVRPKIRGNIEQSTGDTKVRSDKTESVTVNEKDSWWLILAFAAAAALAGAGWIHGWLSPSPRERKINRRNKILEDENKALRESVPETS